MAETELSVAASYYVYFANQQQQQEVRVVADEPGTTSSDCDEEEHANSNQDFWSEDTWTEGDQVQAEALLQTHTEKCSISVLDQQSNEEDGTAWNQFYRDHGTRFFKDRHYLEKAFPNEFATTATTAATNDSVRNTNKNKTLVEIGCGVGNAILPFLEDSSSPWKTIHGLDISKEAIHLLQQDARFVQCNVDTANSGRAVHGHVSDISVALPKPCRGVADVTTLLFCLSALDPDVMAQAARQVALSLKPGGVLVVRDYGRYDEAQMKLGQSRCKLVKPNFYRKHDGTKCFYFTLSDLEQLFRDEEVGLETLELKYLRRSYGNKALGETRRRVWVQGRFVKPKQPVEEE
jgi:SAM-dependent methyltransferase